MKITIETEDKLEGQLLLQAQEYHFLVTSIAAMFREKIKYAEDDVSDEVLKDRELLKDEFYELISDHGINLELLP